MDETSTNILSTRFDELWKGIYEDWENRNNYGDNNLNEEDIQGEMIPIDFEKLKEDQEFLYFLKSLRNR